MLVDEKQCSRCSEAKPLSEFYVAATGQDGHRGDCKACAAEKARQRRADHGEHVRRQDREREQAERARDREAVLSHYGRLCACCGSTEDPCIDHVNGDGRGHRVAVHGSPQGAAGKMYRWLVVNGFPEGFQTLCRPCNSSKHNGPACRLAH